ncbi:hypothetical protein H1R20_g15500, partial [Candolleomyces eurysporus]
MGRNQGGSGKKKEKLKCVTHVPLTAVRQGSSATVKVKKLKVTETGFKVTDSSFHSDVNAAIAAFTWKENNLSDSQLDVVWDRVRQSGGWDQGYVDSFINQGMLPPENDPELPKAKGKGSWNGAHFVQSSLKSLGLRIQLGHLPEERCPRPNTTWGDDFVIIDIDQIHAVGLDYCGYGQTSNGQVEQLLQRRLYPATVVNPKTAATFRVLELFELLQYESKLSTYEFYQTISRLTDNTGLHAPKDRYPTLLRIVHQWRHLKMLKRADMRLGQGYASSGIATVECSRHNAKRPLAVCDMQRGERYCNMDYITILSLQLCLLKLFLISYDIACQWFIHLLARIAQIDPSCPLLQSDVEIRFLVPKFHLPAHVPACRNRFAFMLTPGAGLGDGEAPERGWGELNPLATSTREMGPGTRRDTLDYHFGDYNWRKIIRLGDSLLKKLVTATSEVAEHVIAHQELEATIDPDQLQSWMEAMLAWELDPTSPNPYEVAVKTPTQAAVRRQLAEEEERALKMGADVSLSDEVSPCSLIAMGIDLEGEQRSLKSLTKSLWDHSQDRQITRVKLRSNALTRKLEEWFSLLQLYIPTSVFLRKREPQKKESPKPFEVRLWLPSQIGKTVSFDISLAEIEYKLRNAQAHEALGVLRRNLQIRATLYDVKDRWLRGQGANTRALNAIATVQARIAVARDEYRQARTALLSLADLLGHDKVDQEFLPLEDQDIRSMTEAEPGQGETRRRLSWIWRRVNAADATEEETKAFVAETIRVEWGKSRARAQRYQEEIKLVQEEMNRTLRFFVWKAADWRSKGLAVWMKPISVEHADGLKAYAEHQAALYESLHNAFKLQWRRVPDLVKSANDEIERPDLFYQRKQQEFEKRKKKTDKPVLPLPESADNLPNV